MFYFGYLKPSGTRARRAGSRCAMGPLANPSDESGGGAGDARFERLGRRCGVTFAEPSMTAAWVESRTHVYVLS